MVCFPTPINSILILLPLPTSGHATVPSSLSLCASPRVRVMGWLKSCALACPCRGPSAEIHTALALRFVDGGSYVDVCVGLRAHLASLGRAVWDVVDAVNSTPALAVKFQIGDRTRRQAYGAGYPAGRNPPFSDIIGALDDVAVEQEQPLPTDAACVAEYSSRKEFYAFNVKDICDKPDKLRWMSCMSPGSSQDSRAFSCTSLGQALFKPQDPLTAVLNRGGHCIAADDAYAASVVWAVPWPDGGRGDHWCNSFNFHVPTLQVHIEQAFGKLVWR